MSKLANTDSDPKLKLNKSPQFRQTNSENKVLNTGLRSIAQEEMKELFRKDHKTHLPALQFHKSRDVSHLKDINSPRSCANLVNLPTDLRSLRLLIDSKAQKRLDKKKICKKKECIQRIVSLSPELESEINEEGVPTGRKEAENLLKWFKIMKSKHEVSEEFEVIVLIAGQEVWKQIKGQCKHLGIVLKRVLLFYRESMERRRKQYEKDSEAMRGGYESRIQKLEVSHKEEIEKKENRIKELGNLLENQRDMIKNIQEDCSFYKTKLGEIQRLYLTEQDIWRTKSMKLMRENVKNSITITHENYKLAVAKWRKDLFHSEIEKQPDVSLPELIRHKLETEQPLNPEELSIYRDLYYISKEENTKKNLLDAETQTSDSKEFTPIQFILTPTEIERHFDTSALRRAKNKVATEKILQSVERAKTKSEDKEVQVDLELEQTVDDEILRELERFLSLDENIEEILQEKREKRQKTYNQEDENESDVEEKDEVEDSDEEYDKIEDSVEDTHLPRIMNNIDANEIQAHNRIREVNRIQYEADEGSEVNRTEGRSYENMIKTNKDENQSEIIVRRVNIYENQSEEIVGKMNTDENQSEKNVRKMNIDENQSEENARKTNITAGLISEDKSKTNPGKNIKNSLQSTKLRKITNKSSLKEIKSQKILEDPSNPPLKPSKIKENPLTTDSIILKNEDNPLNLQKIPLNSPEASQNHPNSKVPLDSYEDSSKLPILTSNKSDPTDLIKPSPKHFKSFLLQNLISAKLDPAIQKSAQTLSRSIQEKQKELETLSSELSQKQKLILSLTNHIENYSQPPKSLQTPFVTSNLSTSSPSISISSPDLQPKSRILPKIQIIDDPDEDIKINAPEGLDAETWKTGFLVGFTEGKILGFNKGKEFASEEMFMEGYAEATRELEGDEDREMKERRSQVVTPVGRGSKKGKFLEVKSQKEVTKFIEFNFMNKKNTSRKLSSLVHENISGVLKKIPEFVKKKLKMSRKMLNKMMAGFYEAAWVQITTEGAKDMLLVCYDEIGHRYGLKKVSDRKFLEFLAGVIKNKEFKRCAMFLKLINIEQYFEVESYSSSTLMLYLESYKYMLSSKIGIVTNYDESEDRILFPVNRAIECSREKLEGKVDKTSIFYSISSIEHKSVPDPAKINTGLIELEVVLETICDCYETFQQKMKNSIKKIFSSFIQNELVPNCVFHIVMRTVAQGKYSKIEEMGIKADLTLEEIMDLCLTLSIFSEHDLAFLIKAHSAKHFDNYEEMLQVLKAMQEKEVRTDFSCQECRDLLDSCRAKGKDDEIACFLWQVYENELKRIQSEVIVS